MRHLSALAVLALAGLASPALACPGESTAAAPKAQPVAITAEKTSSCGGEKVKAETVALKATSCSAKAEPVATTASSCSKPTAAKMRFIAFRGGMLPIAVPAVLSSAAMTTTTAEGGCGEKAASSCGDKAKAVASPVSMKTSEGGCCSGKAKAVEAKAETKQGCGEKTGEPVAANNN